MNSRSTVDVAPTTPAGSSGPTARWSTLRVRDVIAETADAVSIAFEVPPDDGVRFAYRPGQFVTLRAVVDDETHLRSYSMSSAPGLDADLRVTVKRVPGGVVSNWLNDHVGPGDALEVMVPTGGFVVDDVDGDVVAFAAGSGITPVFSILKAELAFGDRAVALCYANRDRASTIFAVALDALATRHPDRFDLRLHHDIDHGFVSAEVVRAVAAPRPDAHFFVCGPTGFMDLVDAALRELGIDDDRIHLERFTATEPAITNDTGADAAPAGGAAAAEPAEVTINVGRHRVTVAHRPGTTILQAARAADLRVPSSCETGSCATCMARVVEGRVEMRNNEALTDDEVAEGWVLTCQAVPVSPVVAVVYE